MTQPHSSDMDNRPEAPHSSVIVLERDGDRWRARMFRDKIQPVEAEGETATLAVIELLDRNFR